ncbi:MAG: hypothetical protein EPN31_15630 [Castellaniella sp.]|uniref:hypothetical protein n=1 Tax=Castellaniella sp. TaxID=1955812 RepID=UPI0012184071|nr:hypothetical protein [Castellaniella sp.]TAN25289.1 MAG: hypothetical protein EPN31_15630 [Castellaniella sp.]
MNDINKKETVKIEGTVQRMAKSDNEALRVYFKIKDIHPLAFSCSAEHAAEIMLTREGDYVRLEYETRLHNSYLHIVSFSNSDIRQIYE